MKVAFIKIKLVGAHIGGEEDIGETVVVDVADGYAAAVVEIAEEEAVFQFVVDDLVIKVDAGVVHEFEETGGLFVPAGGAEQYEQEERGAAKEFHVFH